MTNREHSAVLPMDQYERMVACHRRYEFLRCKTPREFTEIWEAAMKGDASFDGEVDKAIEAYDRKCREIIKTIPKKGSSW